MKVLLVGSGGREHALAWKLRQSPHLDHLICAPGNAGMAALGTCINIAADQVDALVSCAQQEDVDFVIIGPEQPLSLGLSDALKSINIRVFGPTQAAAVLESSKAFSKEFCRRHNIPTADYRIFKDPETAQAYIADLPPPYVIKADGLAAGKGVIITHSLMEAQTELEAFFAGKFGQAGQTVIIEAFMNGPEVSFFALCDGRTALALGAAQDHKRAFDGDTGPNTGGMGAYSPTPVFSKTDEIWVMDHIIDPTLKGMMQEGRPFVGILFAGLMMTGDGIKLIEYNVRFGDPECQVLMRRLDSDLMDLLLAAEAGKLDKVATPLWSTHPTVNVVMAAQGYPGAYEKNTLIRGLEKSSVYKEIEIFHAGTTLNAQNQLCATGGRVLNVTAQSTHLSQAVKMAYRVIDDCLDWPQGFCRRDIAHQALN